jgi:hypothetical protein
MGRWQPRVLVGVPTTHNRNAPITHGLTFHTVMRSRAAVVEFRTASAYQTDLNREHLAEAALEGRYTHLLFLDDDIAPPAGALDRLLGWRYPVCTGIYERRTGGLAQGFFNGPGPGFRSLPWPSEGRLPVTVMVGATGAGFLLIDTRVFERLSRPWFQYPPEGEDFFFCRKLAAELAIPILCDPSVRCGHEMQSVLQPGGANIVETPAL